MTYTFATNVATSRVSRVLELGHAKVVSSTRNGDMYGYIYIYMIIMHHLVKYAPRLDPPESREFHVRQEEVVPTPCEVGSQLVRHHSCCLWSHHES